MIIYIRHGDDDPDSYRLDTDLLRRGKERAEKVARELIGLYGLPDVIYYCPLRRTKQTMKAMHSIVRDSAHNKHVHRHIDLQLSRYFTFSERRDRKIQDEVRGYNLPIDDDRKAFERRVTKHADRLLESSTGQVVWCITHNRLIRKVGKYLGISTPKHQEYCFWMKAV